MTAAKPAAIDRAAVGFTPGDLADLLGIAFSDEQLAAITAPLVPFVVVAGAGSGKTSVMTARVVWLVATGQVQPDQVLGLTFTSKAAGELAQRVRRALRRLEAASGASPGQAEPTISTYHAFAGRLIAEHGLRVGVEPASRLLTEGATHQLAQRVLSNTGRDLAGYDATMDTLVMQLLALDAELAEHGVEPVELRAFDTALCTQIDGLPKAVASVREGRRTAQRRIELAHLVDELRAARSARSVLDFSDQMRFAAVLADECPEVGAALRGQFPVVLLDEYQDTSVTQRRLLVGLFGGGHPVTAVGDPLQAIYGWRGASVANIDDFPQHFAEHSLRRRPLGVAGSVHTRPAAVLPLAENRRSGNAILSAANEIAAPLRALHPQVRPLVAAGDRGPGGVRIALLATYEQEMEWVAQRIVEQLAAGTPASDIAVLCRATSDFAGVMAALTDCGVPVDVVGVDGMLNAPEVCEVLAVLEVLHDPTANAALLRLLAGPRWRIGPRDLALLGSRAAQLAGRRGRLDADADLGAQLGAAVAGVDRGEVTSLLDALDDPGDAAYDPAALPRFTELARELRELRRHIGDPLGDLVHRVVVTTGLDIELSASSEMIARGQAAGLSAFVDLVAHFCDADGVSSLGAFLSWLAAAQRFDAVPELDRPRSRDAVALMTVHRSKGLEWPVVALPAITARVFPGSRGRARWTSRPEVLPYPLRGDAAALPVLREWSGGGLTEFAEDCRTHDEREERRLAYVAVTRAARLLLASSSWWGPTQTKPRGPSQYLLQLQELCVSGGGHVDEWAPAPAGDARNPALGEATPLVWPAVGDPVVRGRRLAAADGVRRAVAAGMSAQDLAREWSSGDSVLTTLDAASRELVRGWDEDLRLLLEEADAGGATSDVQLPASLSASDLVRLASDEASYLQSLVRPMPLPPQRSARRGTRFHEWVQEHYDLTALLDPDDLPGAADAGLDADAADLTELRAAFLSGPYADRTPVAVEVPFSLVLAGRVIPGRIDAVFRSPTGGFQVVDWKTSRKHSADPLQLAIYRAAYADLADIPIEQVDAVFCYVRDGAVVRPPNLPGRAALESILRGQRCAAAASD